MHPIFRNLQNSHMWVKRKKRMYTSTTDISGFFVVPFFFPPCFFRVCSVRRLPRRNYQNKKKRKNNYKFTALSSASHPISYACTKPLIFSRFFPIFVYFMYNNPQPLLHQQATPVAVPFVFLYPKIEQMPNFMLDVEKEPLQIPFYPKTQVKNPRKWPLSIENPERQKFFLFFFFIFLFKKKKADVHTS